MNIIYRVIWYVKIEGLCFELSSQERPFCGGEIITDLFLEAGCFLPRLEISKPRENQVQRPKMGCELVQIKTRSMLAGLKGSAKSYRGMKWERRA